MPKQTKVKRVTKRIKGYGVFVRAYGGLIAFSNNENTARKIKITEFSQVSMSRSEDEFKIKPIEIRYSLPTTKRK